MKAKKQQVKKQKDDDEDSENDNSTGKTKCYNCNNFGHMSSECGAPYCSYCKCVDCGHTSHNCLERNTKKKGGNKKTRRIHIAVDDSSDEEGEDYSDIIG